LIYYRVLVLENGRISEFDTPSNLLDDESTVFYSMIKKAGLIFKNERSPAINPFV